MFPHLYMADVIPEIDFFFLILRQLRNTIKLAFFFWLKTVEFHAIFLKSDVTDYIHTSSDAYNEALVGGKKLP